MIDLSQYIRITRQDCRHAALGVIPAFFLIAFGHLTIVPLRVPPQWEAICLVH